MLADVDTSRSTSEYVMTYAGGAFSWQSRQQKTVALSTTEAEYMAAVEAGKEILWMKDFIDELGIRRTRRTIPGRSISSAGITGFGSQ